MFNEEGGAGNNDYERTARLSKFQVGHVSLSGTTVSQSTRALQVLLSSCGSHSSMWVVTDVGRVGWQQQHIEPNSHV